MWLWYTAGGLSARGIPAVAGQHRCALMPSVGARVYSQLATMLLNPRTPQAAYRDIP
jgi:hypothetical protein